MKKRVTSPLHKREKRGEELNINVVANGRRSRMDMLGNETS